MKLIGMLLADTMLAAYEGGMVTPQLEGDKDAVSRELIAFRNYVELLFDV